MIRNKKHVNYIATILSALLLTGCVTVYKNGPQKTYPFQTGMSRLDSALFIIDYKQYNKKGEALPGSNPKSEIEYFKLLLIEEINSCRCFSGYSVVTADDDLSAFKDVQLRFNISIETRYEPDSVLKALLLSGLSIFIIPSWNKVDFKTTIQAKYQNKEIVTAEEENHLTSIRHLFSPILAVRKNTWLFIHDKPKTSIAGTLDLNPFRNLFPEVIEKFRLKIALKGL